MDDKQMMQFHVPLKLSHLNGNCLSKLFQYLNICDLVNLSKANLTDHKNLDQAFTAETVDTTHPYETCIRERFLQLDYTDYCITNNPDCILFEKTTFQLFGTLIPKVRLYYDSKYQRNNAKIEQVIMKYGSSLTEIGLLNADVSAFENINAQFVNVTKLEFDDGWLGPTFFRLHKWFPNLKSLTLNGTTISDMGFFKQENLSLTELSLKNKFLCQYNRTNRNALADNVLDHTISNLMLKRFLNSVPQLKHLSLWHDREDAISESNMDPNNFLIQINFGLLIFIANTMEKLCYLKLNIREMRWLHLPRFLSTFNELKTLVVETSNTHQLTQLNIASEGLDHLEIIVDTFILDNKLLSAFVGRFKRIEYLSIGHHPVDLEDDDLVKTIKSLANLKILQVALCKSKFSDDLCYIIKKFDRLHTVRITCIEIASTDCVQWFLNCVNGNYLLKSKNWRGSFVFNVFEFKKC